MLALAVPLFSPSADGDPGTSAPAFLPGAIQYREIAAPAGVSNTWRGYGFGAGVAAEDLDLDGDADLVLLNAKGISNRIFENVGDPDGLGHPVFVERTQEAGLVDLGESKGIVCADVDNDGLPDLVITSYDESVDRRQRAPNFKSCVTLYRNEGDLRFTDVTAAAGLQLTGLATYGVSAADIDNDGWLDLFVCNRGGYNDIRLRGGGYNELFRNRGDGTFENISESSGIKDELDPSTANLTFQSGFFDFDGDGDLDVYLASDKLGGNQLYRNNGDLTFTDVSESSGAGIRMNGMCVTIGDYDNDLDFDVFVTNTPEGHALLRNDRGSFTNVAWDAGVAAGRIGWGAQWMDVDHDTYLDLYVAHFGVPSNVNSLYHNRGNATFVDIAASSGCGNPADGFGLAQADFDLDGAPDFMVTNKDDACGLFVHEGLTSDWIRFKLVGTTSNRDAVGARLVLHSGATRQLRHVIAGDSYLSHSATEVHFGVGGGMLHDLDIHWPSGTTESIDAAAAGLQLGQRYRIVEGHGVQTGTLLQAHTVHETDGVVKLDWETVQWPADRGFRIERSLVMDGVPGAAEVLAEISDAGRWHHYSDIISDENPERRVYRYAVRVLHADESASLLFESQDISVLPTPVAIQDLRVAATADGVEMRWMLAQSLRSATRSVFVQRAVSEHGPWTTRATLQPTPDMRFVDSQAQAGHAYWYRLVLESHDGVHTASYALGVRVPDGHLPRAALAPPVEPPDGGPVRLSFSVGQAEEVELLVLDVRGRHIATLWHGALDAGTHVVSWNRTSTMGRRVSRGIYFVQLRAGASRVARKLAVLR